MTQKRRRPDARPTAAARGGAVRARDAWSGPIGRVAVLLIVVQLVWRGYYLAKGYFVEDDFLMMHLGATSGLTPAYLFQDYSGHLFPGGFVIAFLQARLAPLSWPVAAVTIALLQLAAAGLAWLLLCRLLGRSWRAVPCLVVCCFGPLTLWSTQWWAVAIQFLPVEICALGAALAFLLWHQDGNRHGRWGSVALVAAALLFQERGLLVPILVLAVALVVDETPGVLARTRVVLVRDRMVWLAMVGVDALYVGLHAWLAPFSSAGRPGQGSSLDLVDNYLFHNLVPGMFGGPWTGDLLGRSALLPPSWVVALGVVLLVALVVPTVRWGGTTARLGWVMLLCYAVADVATVFGGRAFFGALVGYLARYAADATPMLAVTLAAALRETRLPPLPAVTRRLPRSTPVIAALAVSVAFVASSAVTTHLEAPVSYHTAAKTYVTNLRSDLADQPGVTLYDSTVPQGVMTTLFGVDDRVSTVIGGTPGAPPFDVPSEQLRLAGPDGRLQPVTLTNPATAPFGPVRSCGYGVGQTPVIVAFTSAVPYGKNVVQLGYYTNVDDIAVVLVAGQSFTFPVASGLHELSLVVTGTFDSMSIQLTRTTGTLCLASVSAGVPQQSQP